LPAATYFPCMLKRILIIAFFTGSGQLLSVFVLKYLAEHSSIGQLKAIAEIDSLVLFIMNLIALGLQAAAMRNLALTPDWKQEYYETQSARITLGMLLMAAAALAFINEYYVLFLVAPVLAWSGDYALYARGYPITGSIIAFVRLAFPFLALLAGAFYYPHALGWIYVISLTVVYVVTNAYISYFLGTSYIFKPAFRSLRLYFSSLPLGIVALSLYFLGLGLILFAPYMYSTAVVTVAFLGLKFYIIFKGVLRIIHQAFLKEMTSQTVCLKVDQLSTIAGIILCGSVVIFPGSFITLFFGRQYLEQKTFFMLLGINALIYSLFLSFATRAVLQRADRKYTTVTVIAAAAAIAAVMLLSLAADDAVSIAAGLGLGELVWAIGLVYISGSKTAIKDRLVFTAGLLPLLLLPLACRYWLGDRLEYYLISFGLLAGVILLLHHHKFKNISYA
jgi:O-antigen/teichoic acid export membrane protein